MNNWLFGNFDKESKMQIPKGIDVPGYAKQIEESQKVEDANIPDEVDKQIQMEKAKKEYLKLADELFQELQPGQFVKIKSVQFRVQKITKKDIVLRVCK